MTGRIMRILRTTPAEEWRRDLCALAAATATIGAILFDIVVLRGGL